MEATIETVIATFLTWQMLAAYVIIQGAMQTLKRATNAAFPALNGSRAFKLFVTVQNYAWALLIAIPSGFLVGETYGKRAIMGLVAGTLSHVVYRLVMKRFEVLRANPSAKV